MDIIGKLIAKFDAVQVSEKFKKREFVIETPDQYPQKIMLQLTQTKTDLLDVVNIGDEIKCFFNIRGKEWTNKEGKVSYFNTIEAWRIEAIQVQNPEVQSQEAPATTADGDDLPF